MLTKNQARHVLLGAPLTGKTTRLVEAYLSHRAGGFAPGEILCLSFYRSNADAIRRALTPLVGESLHWVISLQDWLVRLLEEYADAAGLPPRPFPLGAATRSLIIRQAWSETDGPLWREFGERPGVVQQLTRVVDWISQNRTGFVCRPGEFSNYELAQVYVRYIDLCRSHHLLTFQETSLRCLDLLSEANIGASHRRRFPVLLVDDLHLARPDQIAVIEALCGAETQLTATAWLEGDEAAPESRLIWETIHRWGGVEHLGGHAPGVSHTIMEVAARAWGNPAGYENFAEHALLLTAFTVEEEVHSTAQSIVRALVADDTLSPNDIAVTAADPKLIPFAQRILTEYGLPVEEPSPAVRHTPLVLGGILALRWVYAADENERLAVERETLALPYCSIDPVDLAALGTAAEEHEKSILSLSPTELPELVSERETKVMLERVREAFAGLLDLAPESVRIMTAVQKLKGLEWAWHGDDWPRKQRDTWTKYLSDWLVAVQEMEETAARIGLVPENGHELVGGLVDQVPDRSERRHGILLLDRDHLNGEQARLNYVLGLSEEAVPRWPSEIQLVSEGELPNLFADGRSVVLPASRDHQVWLEREGRQLVLILTRGRERLRVSVSRYSSGGDRQLPSPFFEQLLADEGEIDRDGKLTLIRPRVWREETVDAEGITPESMIPRMSVQALSPRTHGAAARIFDGHTYSASQLRTYLTCPLQFYFARVLSLDTREPDTFQRGELVHEILCATLGDGSLQSVNLLARKRPSWLGDKGKLAERALAALEAAWSGTLCDLRYGGRYMPTQEWRLKFGPELQTRAVRLWAERLLLGWVEFEVEGWKNPVARQPVLLEVPFTLYLDGYRIEGRIDRVDQVTEGTRVRYQVVDYKTGSGGAKSLNAQLRKFLPLEGEEPADYQLPLYALALKSGVMGLKATPEALNYVNLEYLERTQRGAFAAAAIRTVEMKAGQKVDYKSGAVPTALLEGPIRDGILRTIASMSETPYPAKPGYHCNWCAFRVACDGRQDREGGATE